MQVNRQQYRCFFCLGRHLMRTEYDQPYMPADDMERLVEAHYVRVFRLPDERKQEIRRLVTDEVNRRFDNLAPSKEAAQRRIAQLETERQRLLRLYLAGGLEMSDFQREQDRIAAEQQAFSARAGPGPRPAGGRARLRHHRQYRRGLPPRQRARARHAE